ncbi:MAG: alpha/beta hydrolase [Flavobacteriia bacterium 40-80]|nr:MAG: alpha/beta hydrolase [Flavobacteriia bacterium 40-80]
MIKENSEYQLSVRKDGTSHKLYYSLYQPEDVSAIKATLLILHGMQEHSGRYAEFARFLAKQGFAVVTYDHLGHGKTAQSFEDLGFFVHKNAREQVVTDAESMAAHLEHKFPTVPHFVLGHSMGSFITRCLLQVAHQRFDGAIIVGTGGKIKGIKIGKAIISILNKIAPRYKSAFINNAFVKASNSKFKNEENYKNTNWLSVNKENREAFLKDELCGVPFSHNGFHTLISLNIDATKKDWANGIMKNFPILFISGEDDPIGDFSKGVTETVNNLKKDGFQDVSMKIYSNMRHEILNETEKKEVFNDVVNWISNHLK